MTARYGRLEKSITREELLHAYGTDNSLAEAAQTLHCSVATLRRALAREGIERKGKHWRPRRKSSVFAGITKEWLVEQLKARTMRDVAKELGTTLGNLSSYVAYHGLRPEGYEPFKAQREGYWKKYPDGRKGALANNWRGGRKGGNGKYVKLYKPDHPNADRQGYVMEHRLVMEEKLGRLLTFDEHVHHMNSVKDDNRPENLMLLDHAGHQALHDKEYQELQRYRALYGPLPEE